ncbi:MAG: hypothetical protein QMC70_07625, partial [Bacteroidia bacterium]
MNHNPKIIPTSENSDILMRPPLVIKRTYHKKNTIENIILRMERVFIVLFSDFARSVISLLVDITENAMNHNPKTIPTS